MRDVGRLNCRGFYEKWLPYSELLVKRPITDFLHYCDNLQLDSDLGAHLRGHDGLRRIKNLTNIEYLHLLLLESAVFHHT